MNVVPVILAGGIGSRLWPVSRAFFPKQFQRLVGGHSLFQATLLRARNVSSSAPIIVCNEEHRFMAAEQCREVGIDWQSLILEPEGRNSAPAIALAANAALALDDQSIMLVLPSDHLVSDETAFKTATEAAVVGASVGNLVTFGITPDRPETGYGYIKIADKDGGLQDAQAFVEKPNASLAQEYLESGEYLWNSGMFVMGACSYLEELQRHQPEMARVSSAAIESADADVDFLRPGRVFLESPSESIDCVVMEKTNRAQVVPVDFGWNDMGSWDAVFEELEKDDLGNHFDGDVVSVDTQGSMVLAKNRLVGVLGLDNVVVVETKDAVLIADRDHVQDVKSIVNRLNEENREEH